MQYIDFTSFLSTRYRTCIHASFSIDVLRKYPIVAAVLYQTWYNIEAKGTCKYKFRLEYDDPILESSYVTSQVRYLSDTVEYPNKQLAIPPLPWFKYWTELFFNTDRAPNYLFIDIPICYIFVSTEPATYKPPTPAWMEQYVKNIPVFNLVISETLPNSTNYFLAKDVTELSFHDFVVKITHYEAEQRLTQLREETELFVQNNWGGFRNSVFRLLGFGGKVDRSQIVIQLKRLGDICFGCGDYQAAYNYYYQLYQELSETDPPVGDSLYLMFAISSLMLPDSDIDVASLLNPILLEKRAPLITQIQCGFLSCYYLIDDNKIAKTVKMYGVLYNLIKDSSLKFGFLAFPMIAEAIATVMRRGKSTLWLINASESYQNIGLNRLAVINLWRAYHQIHFSGWPKLQQRILLRIATFGDIPEQLQNFVGERNISFIKDTVSQLSKLDPNKKKLIHFESITIHEMTIEPTGFPQSPPPPGIEHNKWIQLRKRLFPVVYHPSTEEFAATVWAGETRYTKDYSTALAKEHKIEFKITPSINDIGIEMRNVHLLVNPEDAVDVETFDLIELKTTTKMVMKFSPKKICNFGITGIGFDWFGVSPVYMRFADNLRFDVVDNYPLASLTVGTVPPISYLNLPITFTIHVYIFDQDSIAHNESKPSLDTDSIQEVSKGSFEQTSSFDSIESDQNSHLCNTISNIHILAESDNANVILKSPNSQGFQQRWSLDPSIKEQDLVFEATPTTPGNVPIHFFLSYMNTYHVTRFAYCLVSFECNEVHKLKIVQSKDAIDIQGDDDISHVECDSAKISVDGSHITILEANPEFTSDRSFITIRRNFAGNEMTDFLHINDIFLRFSQTVFTFKQPQQAIRIEFDAICLGKNEGLIVLHNKINSDFFITGKVKFTLHGPGTNKIAIDLIVSHPCEIDLDGFMTVEYGKTQLKMAQTIKIE